jgi:hypothetical protein
MDDGHTGVSYNQVNQGESGNFKLVLSYLKQSTGSGEFVIHATSNVAYSFGADHFEFLSKIGFTQYQGQCSFLQGQCFYRIIACPVPGKIDSEQREKVWSNDKQAEAIYIRV